MRSRVDRLEPNSKAAIVAASVLGPEFSLGGLASVTDLGVGLAPSVQALRSANLLAELRKLPEPKYSFRHSLIQDAIYRGLLRHQRRHLHALAAAGLEATSTAPTDIAGLLGRHYTIAGHAERAAHYLELAGDGAAAAHANDEVITSYRSAVDVLGDEQELVMERYGSGSNWDHCYGALDAMTKDGQHCTRRRIWPPQDLEEAIVDLEGALGSRPRAGDKSIEPANLAFLGWGRLRQHDVPAVKDMILLADELFHARAFPSAVMLKALRSWVAWKEERDREAEGLALEALEQWRPTVVRYPFCSICLWPLTAAPVADGRYDQAIAAARELERPPQTRLPYELEVSVQSAISDWESTDRPETRGRLQKVRALAEELAYL